MKIFHVSRPQTLKLVRNTGVIETSPQIIQTYNDYGEEIEEIEHRVYFCKSYDAALILKSAFERYFDDEFEIAEFETEVSEEIPDPNFRGLGFFSRQDINLIG